LETKDHEKSLIFENKTAQKILEKQFLMEMEKEYLCFEFSLCDNNQERREF